MFYSRSMPERTAQDIVVDSIAFTIRHRCPELKWKRDDENVTRLVAQRILQGMEQSRILVTLRAPAEQHSMPLRAPPQATE